jgi:hypothetical protein
VLGLHLIVAATSAGDAAPVKLGIAAYGALS